MSSLVEKVEASVANICFTFWQRKRVALAVSGGIDSMCMALMFKEISQRNNFTIKAFVVNHNIRKGSREEADQVCALLQKEGIPAEVLHYEGEKFSSNIQEKARNIRYELLINACKKAGIPYLCTAHNSNDNAETILQRIIRGTGVKGVAGIFEQMRVNDTTIFRPMLNVSRKEIEEYMSKQNIPVVQDPSNNDPRYLRTHCRQMISSFYDSDTLVKRLNLLASNMSRVEEHLTQETSKQVQNTYTADIFGYGKLDLKKFTSLDKEIALRVLAHAAGTVGKDITASRRVNIDLETFQENFSPRLKGLENLYRKLCSYGATVKTTFNGCEVIGGHKNKNHILFIRELHHASKNIPVSDKSMLWDGRF